MRFKFSILSILLTLVFGISIMQPAVSSDRKQEEDVASGSYRTCSTKTTSSAFIYEGIELFEQGKFKEAAKIFSEHSRGNPVVYHYLKYLHQRQYPNKDYGSVPASDAAALDCESGKEAKAYFDASIEVLKYRGSLGASTGYSNRAQASRRQRANSKQAWNNLIQQFTDGSAPAACAMARLPKNRPFKEDEQHLTYQRAISTGDLREAANFAKQFPKEMLGKQSITAVADLYERLLPTHDNDGEVYLGLATIYSHPKNADIALSSNFLKMAARLGNLTAQKNLVANKLLDQELLFWNLQLADQGSPYGCAKAGAWFARLPGGPQKVFFYHTRALEIAKQTSDIPKEDLALFLEKLGVVYLDGIGTTPDTEKAKGYFLEGAKLGAGNSIIALGVLFFQERDYDNALEWLSKLTNPPADVRYTIGACHLNLGNIDAGVKQWLELAEGGHDGARVDLVPLLDSADRHFVGWSKVAQWMESASQNKSPIISGPAHGYLGWIYAQKLANEPDPGSIIKHLKLSYSLGDVIGTFLLAQHYELCKHIGKDKAKAIELYKFLIEQGHPLSRARLGLIYAYYKCASEDDQEKYYKLAVECLVESCLLDGSDKSSDGHSREMQEAIKSLSHLAALNLAKMCVLERGGLRADLPKIYAYLDHAAQEKKFDSDCNEILLLLGARCLEQKIKCDSPFEEAWKAFDRVACKSEPRGWYNLGVTIIMKPELSKQDVQNAIAYWRLAFTMGLEGAALSLEQLVSSANSLIIKDDSVSEVSEFPQQKPEGLDQKTRKFESKLAELEGRRQIKWEKLRGLMGDCIKLREGSLKAGKGSKRLVTIGNTKTGYHHPHGRKENSFSGGRLRSLSKAMNPES